MATRKEHYILEAVRDRSSLMIELRPDIRPQVGAGFSHPPSTRMLASKMLRTAPTYMHRVRLAKPFEVPKLGTLGARARLAPRGASALLVRLAVEIPMEPPPGWGSARELARAQAEPWGKPADGGTFCADYGKDSRGWRRTSFLPPCIFHS